ncbi:hypothetical protein BDF22DRAFT_734006 [Syncephalis plumigaleata]|nr:hypothetical protein BDF22DRAFT_734006 [Syncephalis plumigaleata]
MSCFCKNKHTQQRIDTHVRQLFEEYDAISKDVMSNVQEMLQQVHTRLKQQCDQLTEHYTNGLEGIRRVEQEQERMKRQLMDLVQLLNSAFNLLSNESANHAAIPNNSNSHTP